MVSCFSGVGDPYDGRPNDAPRDPKNGQVYAFTYWWTEYKYIYIYGSWYEYSGSTISGNVAPTICHTHGDGKCTCSNAHIHGDGKCTCSLHVHGDGDCICVTPEHQHSSSCYNCGKTEHTHSVECKDDEAICGITENHTHNNTCKNSGRTNTVKTVTRKYQASLDDIWHHTDANGEQDFGLQDDNGVIYEDGQRWEPSDSSYYKQVLVYIANMPADDFTLTLNTSTNSIRTMYYYLQVLPGEEYTESRGGKQYIMYNTIEAKYGRITEAEDYFDITGYVKSGSNPSFSGGEITATTARFYYDRITDHKLQFKNNGILLDKKQVYGLMYGAPLKEYNFKPDYPSNLEPNAYYFDKWYTSAGYYEGTEVNWETLTMPVEDLLLHARWLPLTYDVYFYRDYSRLQNGTAFQSVKDTAHGEKMITSGVDLTPTHDKDHTYQFVGWFYLDSEGNKTAFNPAEMAVRQELHLYAEWSTMTVKEYAVSYAQGRWDEATKTVIPMEGS